MSSGCCRAAAEKGEESGRERPKYELADVVRRFGEAYRRSADLPDGALKVLRDIESCRTARLGGHLQRCEVCGYEAPLYNSCLNRHCPKCQSLKKARWLEARRSELLPVGYFHTVFPPPHELNGLMLYNQRVMYDLLFASASGTLRDFAAGGEHGIEGQLGITALLHTWDQRLGHHPHLHCVVTGGALGSGGQRWTHSPSKEYLFPVRALSRVFRGKFLAGLKRLYRRGKLRLGGSLSALQDPKRFQSLLDRLYAKEWLVYCKPPFAGPEKVLEYLGRYTHRVAISNHRLLNVDDEGVTFTWRDRANGNRQRTMTLKGREFLRRFMLHVLPKGFVRIRYFGFLAGPERKRNLETCRRLLEPKPAPASGQERRQEARPEKTVAELFLELTGKPIDLCPRCRKGRMVRVRELPPVTGPPTEKEAAA